MMHFYARTQALILFLLGCLFVGQAAYADHDLAREPLPKSWKADAELTDVFFLNEQLGWSVGAQGVILRTTDGGRNWSEISNAKNSSQNELSLDQKFHNMRRGISTGSTGVVNESESAHHSINCRFESIHFIDENFGWIAGGYEVPYVDRSRAVILRTNDGGKSWHNVEGLLVPRINKIRFSNRAVGWAIGETGNLFSSGLFMTTDGGATWESPTSSKWKNWQDAVEVPGGYVAIDDEGLPNVIGRERYETSVLDRSLTGRFNELVMTDANAGFAVGENGMFARTANGGMSWSAVDLNIESLPLSAVSDFDFHSITKVGKDVLFAGSPGTHLFRHDTVTGKTTALRTSIESGIRRICFVDENNGWAVGSLGKVIATHDGGKNWELQRGKNLRVAMLCVASNFQELPLEILAKYASEDERICATAILNATPEQVRVATQAAERLGSVTSVSYLNDQDVLRKLVREIRVLRPSVVVCNSDRVSANQTMDPVVLLEQAIRMAADSLSFPQQINSLGLEAWQVSRLVTLDPVGEVAIDGDRLLPRTGMLIEDHVSVSRALLGKSVLNRKGKNYRVSHYLGSHRVKAGDFLSGMSGTIPTRAKSSSRGNLRVIQQASNKQKKFDQFVKFDATTPQDFLVWRQQVESFVIPMDQNLAGIWMMQLTERYLEVGKMELAAAASAMLATRWPNHSLAPAALTWLSQYYASAEFGNVELAKRFDSYSNPQSTINSAGALEDIQKPVKPVTTMQITQQDGLSKVEWVATEKVETAPYGAVQRVGYTKDRSQMREEFFDQRLRMASHYLSRISQRDPELMASSQYRFLEAQITRRINGGLDTEGRFRNLTQRNEFSGEGISIGAKRELEILGSVAGQEQVVAKRCLKTKQRPVLDGNLDEPTWRSIAQAGELTRSRIQLFESGIERPDVVMFAYDDEYLYGAVHCQKLNIDYSRNTNQARPRDPDLTGRDRVEIVFDLDRDYRSTNRFVIDHRGWVSESSAGSSSWNPNWYVSQSETESTWTVEFAMPLDEIMTGTIEAGETWAIQLSRRAFDYRDLWKPVGQEVLQDSGFSAAMQASPRQFELFRFEAPSQPSQSD